MEAYEDPIACAERGDVDFFKTVAPEILLNARNRDLCSYKTVLTAAAMAGHLDCCEVIVQRCPQLLYHQDDFYKGSVLHWVVAYSRDIMNIENIMRFLLFTADSKPDLELGGGPKIPNYTLLTIQDHLGWTALHRAVMLSNHGATKLLLEADRDFRVRRMVDNRGKTCLHLAVERGNRDMVKLICEADLDKQLLSMPDADNNTPLHLAMHEAGAARDESGSDSLVICKLLLEKDPSQYTKLKGDKVWTPLHYAASHGLNSVVNDIIGLCPDCMNTLDFHGQNVVHVAAYHGHLAVVQHFLQFKDTDVALFTSQDKDGNTPYTMAMGKILSDGYGECSDSDSEIICMLLKKDPEQCKIRTGDTRQTYLHLATSRGHLSIIKDIIKLWPDCPKIEDTHKQTFIHIAAKHGFENVAKFILESKEIENTMLNAQDKDGNTPLHIAALNKSQKAALCLLYDARVDKGIENDKREKAIDLIDFPYDEAKARVYSLGHQRDLKDQSSFDLLVATLIATVSFAAGITLPGGYISDGVNKGSAILLKATAFKVFIVSNNFALLFALYTVFLNFSTRRLLKEEDIYYESSMGTFRTRLLLKKKDMIYQLNAATLCTLSAIYAMVVAFITGSYAVLANSDGLAITVCVSSCFFLILASQATWTMAMQYWRVPKVSS